MQRKCIRFFKDGRDLNDAYQYEKMWSYKPKFVADIEEVHSGKRFYDGLGRRTLAGVYEDCGKAQMRREGTGWKGNSPLV
jgi:hypothetical protein